MSNFQDFKLKANAIYNSKRNLFKKYNVDKEKHNTFQIDNIIYDNRSKIVTTFKENLIWNEPTELLRRFYDLLESLERMPFIWEAFYYDESQLMPNTIKLEPNKFLLKNQERKKKVLKVKEEEEQRTLNSCNIMEKSKFFNDQVQEILNKLSLSCILEKNNSFLNKSEFISYNNSFIKNNHYDSDEIEEISLINKSHASSFSDLKSLKGIIEDLSKKTPNKSGVHQNNNNNKNVTINLKLLKEKIKTEKYLSYSIPNNKCLINSTKTQTDSRISTSKVDRYSFVTNPVFNHKTCFMNFISKQPIKSTIKQKMKLIKAELLGQDSKLTNDSKQRVNTKPKTSNDNTKPKIDVKENLSSRSSNNPKLICSSSKNNLKNIQTQNKCESINGKKLATIPEVNKNNKIIKKEGEVKKESTKTFKKFNSVKIEKQNNVNFISLKKKNLSSVNINLNVNVNVNINNNNNINQKTSEEVNFFSEKMEKENLFVISEINEKNPTPFLLCDEEKNYNPNKNVELASSKLSDLHLDLPDIHIFDVKKNIMKNKINLRKTNKVFSKPFNCNYTSQKHSHNDTIKKDNTNIMSRNTPKQLLNKPDIDNIRHTINNFQLVNFDASKLKKTSTSTTATFSKLVTPRKNNPLQLNTTKTNTSTKVVASDQKSAQKSKVDNMKPISKEKKTSLNLKKNHKNLSINTKNLPSINTNSGANTTKSSKDKIKNIKETPKHSNQIKIKLDHKK